MRKSVFKLLFYHLYFVGSDGETSLAAFSRTQLNEAFHSKFRLAGDQMFPFRTAFHFTSLG